MISHRCARKQRLLGNKPKLLSKQVPLWLKLCQRDSQSQHIKFSAPLPTHICRSSLQHHELWSLSECRKPRWPHATLPGKFSLLRCPVERARSERAHIEKEDSELKTEIAQDLQKLRPGSVPRSQPLRRLPDGSRQG